VLKLVLLGANDACRPLRTTCQHVPMKQYRENLAEIITHPNITAHDPTILLVTPPPVDQIRIHEVDTREYGHEEATRYSSITAEYSQTAREVAAEIPGVVLIDLWKGLMDHAISKTPGFAAAGQLLGSPECGQQGGLKDLLPDGLHLSGEAYKIFLDLILPHIMLPSGETEGYLFPGWKEMNS
jgi:lysophospholipase L1-like esterase